MSRHVMSRLSEKWRYKRRDVRAGRMCEIKSTLETLYTGRSYTHGIDLISFRLNGSLDSLRERDRIGIICTNTFINEAPITLSSDLDRENIRKPHFYFATYFVIYNFTHIVDVYRK